MARTGLFGGTFDPPHLGHLIVAQDVVERLALDRLLFVPALEPPHKVGRMLAPAESRLRMLQAAVGGDSRFEVSRMEVDRPGLSYTVDTLRALRRHWPDDRLHLLIGADQLQAFGSWRAPAEIARLARVVVMARAGVEPTLAPQGVTMEYDSVPVTRVDISSSEVRRRVEEGRSIRYWVPDAVGRIIEEEQLYTRRTEAGTR